MCQMASLLHLKPALQVAGGVVGGYIAYRSFSSIRRSFFIFTTTFSLGQEPLFAPLRSLLGGANIVSYSHLSIFICTRIYDAVRTWNPRQLRQLLPLALSLATYARLLFLVAKQLVAPPQKKRRRQKTKPLSQLFGEASSCIRTLTAAEKYSMAKKWRLIDELSTHLLSASIADKKSILYYQTQLRKYI